MSADTPLGLTRAPANYVHDFRPCDGAAVLLVSLSASQHMPSLKLALPMHHLRIADLGREFYVRGASPLAGAICALADGAQVQQVIFVGSSKAGFGALLLAGLCARRRAGRYHALVFSAQTRLFPEQPDLNVYPAYANLLRTAEQDAELKQGLIEHGSVDFIRGMRGIAATLVYGDACPPDAAQALRIQAPNIRKFPIASAMHASAAPFAIGDIEPRPEWRSLPSWERMVLDTLAMPIEPSIPAG